MRFELMTTDLEGRCTTRCATEMSKMINFHFKDIIFYIVESKKFKNYSMLFNFIQENILSFYEVFYNK